MKHKYKDQNDVDVCCDVHVYVKVSCDAGSDVINVQATLLTQY